MNNAIQMHFPLQCLSLIAHSSPFSLVKASLRNNWVMALQRTLPDCCRVSQIYGGGGERYTALADGPPRSAGFILSRGEGHELSKDEQIRVFANEVKSRPAPAEHAGQQRTEARRGVRNTAQTF